MVSLQAPVIYPTLRAKQAGLYPVALAGPSMKPRTPRSEFWGFRGTMKVKTRTALASRHSVVQKPRMTQCSFSSSADGNGSMADNFNENDEDYVTSSVVEAVEVKSGADGFMIKMRDGRHLRCVHNNPQGGHLPDYAPHPAMVLKMEDGTDLLLPIIVLEMPSALLMAAVRNVQIARPTLYQVVAEMIDKMGYKAKLVRVTRRVHEAYFAQLYLSKAGNKSEFVSFDLRPSDAINIAVRCQVPIQVNKYLAYSDGMRVIESGNSAAQTPGSDGLLFSELDRPNGQPCIETKEFDLMRNMLIAAVEERYSNAGMSPRPRSCISFWESCFGPTLWVSLAQLNGGTNLAGCEKGNDIRFPVPFFAGLGCPTETPDSFFTPNLITDIRLSRFLTTLSFMTGASWRTSDCST